MKIRHMVIFNLKYEKDSPEAQDFLTDGAARLQSIPVVRDFELLRQISPKNPYAYGFSMTFASEEAYQSYNTHPLHVAFVQDRWVDEVVAFLEIDFALDA